VRRLIVTAAVIERDGRFLVTRRPKGSHLEGCWEFPGGKCDPDEALETCLRREMVEELDSDVRVGREVHRIAHTYPERVVELHFFRCELLSEPQPVLGQEMRWVAREDLGTLEFLPADAELIVLLASGTNGDKR
jgi:8-oxo-dGTP diphosphatase